MNKALVELIRKYENKVKKTQAHSGKAWMFYAAAAEQVLKLAKQ